jgi:hypothetical protein
MKCAGSVPARGSQNAELGFVSHILAGCSCESDCAFNSARAMDDPVWPKNPPAMLWLDVYRGSRITGSDRELQEVAFRQGLQELGAEVGQIRAHLSGIHSMVERLILVGRRA